MTCRSFRQLLSKAAAQHGLERAVCQCPNHAAERQVKVFRPCCGVCMRYAYPGQWGTVPSRSSRRAGVSTSLTGPPTRAGARSAEVVARHLPEVVGGVWLGDRGLGKCREEGGGLR